MPRKSRPALRRDRRGASLFLHYVASLFIFRSGIRCAPAIMYRKCVQPNCVLSAFTIFLSGKTRTEFKYQLSWQCHDNCFTGECLRKLYHSSSSSGRGGVYRHLALFRSRIRGTQLNTFTYFSFQKSHPPSPFNFSGARYNRDSWFVTGDSCPCLNLLRPHQKTKAHSFWE